MCTFKDVRRSRIRSSLYCDIQGLTGQDAMWYNASDNTGEVQIDMFSNFYKEFLERNNIKFSCERGAPENPEFKNCYGWTVTFEMDGKKFEMPFYMGIGHNGREPEPEEVLECVVSDAQTLEDTGGTFEGWCEFFGYDWVDEYKRENKIYKSCLRQSVKLAEFLGEDKFNKLIDWSE